MALAGALAVPRHDPDRVREGVLSLVTVVIAAASFGWLVPPVLTSLSAPQVAQPASVSLLGTITTDGLPAVPAVSRLAVRNDGPAGIRWSVTTQVTGEGSSSVHVVVWVPTGEACTPQPTAPVAIGWSREVLAPGAALPLCVRIAAIGDTAGIVQPRVTVDAQPA